MLSLSTKVFFGVCFEFQTVLNICMTHMYIYLPTAYTYISYVDVCLFPIKTCIYEIKVGLDNH